MTSNLKQAIIMRGLPGSGKSTLLRHLVQNLRPENYRIHSTDLLFYEDGQYQFDAKKLPEFHEKNFDQFNASLKAQIPLVICDNTNIEIKHLQSYIDSALKAGYEVDVINVGLFEHDKALAQYAKRNRHQVSLSVIQNMSKKSSQVNF